MSDNIRSIAHACTHGVMPRWLPLFLAASMIALAGCDARPAATVARPDSTKNATAEVTRGTNPDGAQGAGASDPVAPSRVSAGANDTATVGLNPGRSRHDEISYSAAIRAGRKAMANWPAAPAVLSGAILPQYRIVAYYGNPHSKRMGVLGEYPEQEMLSMLDNTVAMWRKADPSTPVIPAIHLVAVVAQGYAGPDGKWRLREGPDTIEQAYRWAQSRQGLLFVDIQAGHSTLQQELPPLLGYLERPDVHLGVDPEFYMHYKRKGIRPSAKVGQMMSTDVNYVIQVLDQLVREKNLPPKILVVHRFRADMMPDAENIKPTPRVQVVMHMDGWGPPWLKFDSYKDYIVQHPVAFTGFKFFYHNDTKGGEPMLTEREVLQLLPHPLYLQYQ
ncbi:MAG: hypothetical protein DME00_32590 [Candidatus Rokuibacteriota bacterium]|nr:MAG: hypothetical protein DME00_32590 [Candidatus Rokubacteria bacterium]